MIIKNQGSEAISAGVIDTIDVGISSRPEDQLMILNILSDTLYTDKISAVWREYGVNGVDANIEAGRGDKPIEITLPTATNPNAVIRDFGYGMSGEQVRGTYCMAGASTKRNSNEVTGCLGIGSKAGYAYGPAFTVTSFQNGKKTVYNCYKDNGIPRMAVLQEADAAGEPDGVEISVPVRRPDIPEFISRAERVFRYFKVRPIVKGGELKFKLSTAHLTGTGWKFTAEEHSVAVMGNVGYDLDYRMLPGDFPPKKKGLVEAGIELYFPLGALEISANREGIQYKDDTLKAISHALGVALNEIAGVFTDQVKNAPSLWEATKVYAGLFDKTGSYGMRTMRDTLSGKVTWKGIPLKSGRFDISIEDRGSKSPGASLQGVRTLEYSQRSYAVRGKRLNKYNNPYEVPAHDGVQFVLNDNKPGAISVGKVRYWFEQNQSCNTVVVLTFDDAKAQAAYWKARHMDGVPLVNMSAMPKPPLIPGQSGGPSAHRSKHQARVLALDETKGSYTYPKSANWTPVLVDKTQFGVYVLIDGYEPCGASQLHSCDRAREILKAARSLGFIRPNEKLLGVKLRDGKPATKLGDKWISINNLLMDKLDKRFTKNPTLAQELADYIESTGYTPFLAPKVASKLVAGCPARTLLEEYVRMKDGLGLRYLHLLYQYAPSVFSATLPTPTAKLESQETKLWQRYPMLKYAEYSLRHSDKDNELQKAVDYINMVELMNNYAGRTSKP